MNREEFDPEVYGFYKDALEGAGFAADTAEIDIYKLRDMELTGHLANLDPYDDIEKHDVFAERDGADPMRLRVYVPETAGDTENGLPVILYFHGGGFIMGSIEDHDPLCGKLADECGAVVIAADYRLAPEHPFPACIEDAVFTAGWALKNAHLYGGDPAVMLAAGDSSGANMAAVLALLAREGNAPGISGLLLFYGIYGCVDIGGSESGRLYGQGGYVLPLDSARAMMDLYLPEDVDPDDVRLNPGRAKDLSGMPPAIVVTAELDILRDDGIEFARRLEEAGNKVCHLKMDGMMHGFALYWQRFSRAEKLLEDIGRIHIRDIYEKPLH